MKVESGNLVHLCSVSSLTFPDYHIYLNSSDKYIYWSTTKANSRFLLNDGKISRLMLQSCFSKFGVQGSLGVLLSVVLFSIDSWEMCLLNCGVQVIQCLRCKLDDLLRVIDNVAPKLSLVESYYDLVDKDYINRLGVVLYNCEYLSQLRTIEYEGISPSEVKDFGKYSADELFDYDISTVDSIVSSSDRIKYDVLKAYFKSRGYNADFPRSCDKEIVNYFTLREYNLLDIDKDFRKRSSKRDN